MKLNKYVKYIIALLFIMIVLISLPFLFVNIDISYTKNDIVRYKLFTMDEIKKAPYISEQYTITYKSPDGNTPLINEILFFNTDSIELLKKYTESMGFKHVTIAPWENTGFKHITTDTWEKQKTKIVIMKNDAEKSVLFSVEKY